MKGFKFPARLWCTVMLTALATTSCRPKMIKLASPPHYNFASPNITKLHLDLREISGIVWDPQNNVFLAINDEKGKLYFLDRYGVLASNPPVFGDNGDYEDIAMLNGAVYILRSDGAITKFMKDSTGNVYGIEEGKISLSGSNDFETMYGDPARKALILICKNCKTDDDKSVSAFAYYPDSIGFDKKPVFTIDADKVKELSPVKSVKFQPSAAAIHPVLQKLFILSSASHQLVVTDLNGNVDSVYRLTPKLFPQPEGITFTKNGDMYISNESKTAKATLLRFAYLPGDTGKIKVEKAGYDFSRPDEKMELGKHLHEISGMAWIPEKNIMLAENDEKGDIYFLDFNKNDKVDKVKFGGKGDYEDIVYTATAIYMLVSDGTIVEVETRDSSFSTKEFALEEKKNEFEALYLDAADHSLIMLCKQCNHEKDEIRKAFRFDLATHTFDAEPAYIIAIRDIRKMLNDNKADFKPSAAAINPLNGKLYIVASVGKLLVIADRKGKIEQVFRLDPGLFNQPEGMTFAPNGDLYISNEGGDGVATILKFVYKK